MKTNNYNTGNVLRDMYLQSFFHGLEYQALICTSFGWNEYHFKKQMEAVKQFSPEVSQMIIALQIETIQVRILHANTYQWDKYDNQVFR